MCRKTRKEQVAQCRRLLVSGALDEARDLWNALVDQARQARLGDGTIDLAYLSFGTAHAVHAQ